MIPTTLVILSLVKVNTSSKSFRVLDIKLITINIMVLQFFIMLELVSFGLKSSLPSCWQTLMERKILNNGSWNQLLQKFCSFMVTMEYQFKYFDQKLQEETSKSVLFWYWFSLSKCTCRTFHPDNYLNSLSLCGACSVVLDQM